MNESFSSVSKVSSRNKEKMEENFTISLLSKNPIPESLDSKSSENRKASNSSKTISIKDDDINPSPKRWIIVILFFIFSANTAFQVKSLFVVLSGSPICGRHGASVDKKSTVPFLVLVTSYIDHFLKLMVIRDHLSSTI